MTITTATKITIVRICMIPFFVWCAVVYARSVAGGHPQTNWRNAAIWIFAVAAASDGVDGFIARRFNQISPLGKLLDPIADKSLLLGAIITLTLCEWAPGLRFPLWFLLLILCRNLFIVIGGFIVRQKSGNLNIRPQWSGKCNTVAQMVAVSWVLLGITWLPLIYPVVVASIFAVISWFAYVRDGLRQIRSSHHATTPN